MKNVLKYLLLLITAVAFWNFTDTPVNTVSEEASEDWAITEAVYQTNIAASDSELCLPRQESLANGQRVQSNARRTGSAQRNNLEFTKSGKIFNAGLKYFNQRKSIIIHSSLIEPAHKLLYLGRLII